MFKISSSHFHLCLCLRTIHFFLMNSDLYEKHVHEKFSVSHYITIKSRNKERGGRRGDVCVIKTIKKSYGLRWYFQNKDIEDGILKMTKSNIEMDMFRVYKLTYTHTLSLSGESNNIMKTNTDSRLRKEFFPNLIFCLFSHHYIWWPPFSTTFSHFLRRGLKPDP